MSPRYLLRSLFRLLAVVSAVAAVTTLDYRLLHVNSPTAAFSYLLLILGIATRMGLRPSIAASVISMLVYNFFFLPPVGTLTVADPQNWVALFVFLVTAVTASHLSSSARRKADEAAAREREMQRMYDFSRALMLRDSARGLAVEVTHQISMLFAIEDIAFFERATDTIHRSIASGSQLPDDVLRDVARTGTVWQNTASAALAVPVRLGGPNLGSLAVAGSANVSEVALQAIAQLIAIAIERARSQDAAAHAEAARQNEQLKSTLLDALAHEFKTPLTCIKAAAGSVLSRGSLNAVEQDLVTVVDEEADHLNNLVSEAIELARIGAGPVKLRREPFSVGQLIESAMAHLRALCEGRQIDVTIEPDLPPIEIDSRLSELALRQLLSNALKYSTASSPIHISAENLRDEIVIRVSNFGPPIPKPEQSLIFEKFYRGRDARLRVPGTGMGLAIAREIAEAHGGRIWFESDSEKCTQFSFSLPAVPSKERTPAQRVHTVA